MPITRVRSIIMPLIKTAKLQPYYDGRVLMNDTASNDPVVRSVLDDLEKRNFTFHTATGMQTWNISDRH